MNSITEFFPSYTETLGWTLLNSLWQAMVVTLLVVITLRIVPSRSSKLRYALACAGMAFIVVLNAATFIYLCSGSGAGTASQSFFQHNTAGPGVEKTGVPPAQELLAYTQAVLASNMPLIILGWCIGTILFSLRMISGWWYLAKLRTEALVLDDAWSERLQVLARQLGINRLITLAQSARIHSPMVIGCLKPIVLVPAGMLSGLSAEQVEAIFIHELAHIRRHDYIINLIQSFIEALFFFNPFVWAISGIIRREREYCCDDTVIIKHRSPLAYAHALARLEEVRLTRAAFALSLAENKNQLLNRIKRIMEKSAKNYTGKDRLIPAVLLVVGLICASWLTITTDPKTRDADMLATQEAPDTVIKKNEKSARYSRRSVTTYDEKGEPREEVVESYEGDEAMRQALMPLMAFDFTIPQAPVEPFVPPIPGLSAFTVPMPPHFNFHPDSIPGPKLRYGSEEDWKEFSEAFEKKFREHFNDFYQSNEKDFEKMMKDMEQSFADKFKSGDWEILLHDMALAEVDHEIADLELSIGEMAEQAQEIEEHVKEQMTELHEVHGKELERMEQEAMEQAKKLEEQMKAMEADMRSYERELNEMLVKDGYLGKNEKLETIHWREDSGLEINGKTIREADRKKYDELRRKYFKNNGPRYIE
jgi:bla regulator protein blaR1